MLSTRRVSMASVVGWALVASAVVWVTVIRAGLIAAGADIDHDALDHAYIARRLLTEWRDLRLHWVWLPLWHVVGAMVVTLHGSITTVRWLNVALSALSPVLLTETLRRHLARASTDAAFEALPYVAGASLAVFPLGIGVGEFAQPEALFQLLVLSVAAAWAGGRHVLASALLGLACTLRYEAWILPPLLALLALRDRPRHVRPLLALAIPVAAVLAWCVIHRLSSGEWLQFIRVNRAYVREAWQALGLASRTELRVRHPWLWYPLLLPWDSLGPFTLVAFAGAPWWLSRGPRALGALSLGLLAFITLVWVRRTNLGLPRHFVAVVPLVATSLAAGLCTAVSRLRLEGPRAYALSLGLGALSLGWIAAHPGAREIRALRVAHARSLRDERLAAEALRASLGPRQRVFCDLRDVEVLSGLPVARFIHWNVADVGNFNMGIEAYHRGAAFALSAPSRMAQLTKARTVFATRSVALVRRDPPTRIDHFIREAPEIP